MMCIIYSLIYNIYYLDSHIIKEQNCSFIHTSRRWLIDKRTQIKSINKSSNFWIEKNGWRQFAGPRLGIWKLASKLLGLGVRRQTCTDSLWSGECVEDPCHYANAMEKQLCLSCFRRLCLANVTSSFLFQTMERLLLTPVLKSTHF